MEIKKIANSNNYEIILTPEEAEDARLFADSPEGVTEVTVRRYFKNIRSGDLFTREITCWIDGGCEDTGGVPDRFIERTSTVLYATAADELGPNVVDMSPNERDGFIRRTRG